MVTFVVSTTCDLSYDLYPQLCPGSPPGVWICSTDMTLTLQTKPREFSLMTLLIVACSSPPLPAALHWLLTLSSCSSTLASTSPQPTACCLLFFTHCLHIRVLCTLLTSSLISPHLWNAQVLTGWSLGGLVSSLCQEHWSMPRTTVCI